MFETPLTVLLGLPRWAGELILAGLAVFAAAYLVSTMSEWVSLLHQQLPPALQQPDLSGGSLG